MAKQKTDIWSALIILMCMLVLGGVLLFGLIEVFYIAFSLGPVGVFVLVGAAIPICNSIFTVKAMKSKARGE